MEVARGNSARRDLGGGSQWCVPHCDLLNLLTLPSAGVPPPCVLRAHRSGLLLHTAPRGFGAWEKLCEQDLRANVPLFSVGALAPLNHLGPGELIVEEISLVLVSVGHDERISEEVFHFRQDRWEPWSVLEIGGPNPVDLDGLGVDRPIRVDPGAPRLALAPALAELRGKVGDGVSQAADFISAASSIPSLNFTPSMTFGNWF